MYLLDASTLITPFHLPQLQALSKALGFASPEKAKKCLQDWFFQGITSGKLRIAREVRDEVMKKKVRPEYQILKAVEGRYELLDPREDTYSFLAEAEQFIRKNYEPHQAEAFLRKPDPMLIALAKSYELTLVTEEKHTLPEVDGSTGRIKGEPRLPFVAFAFGVRCISLMAAINESSWLRTVFC